MTRRSLKTDIGTVLIHWTLVACVVVLVGTGLRIASHDPGLSWLAWFDLVLPRENLWYWHLVGAIAFVSVLAAYVTYVVAARLGQRLRLDLARLASLSRKGATRWATLALIVLWVGIGAFTAEIVSGIVMLLGNAAWAQAIHRHAVWVCIAFQIGRAHV